MSDPEMVGSRVAAPAERVQGPESGSDRALTYMRWAAIVALFLYTAGYATVGFGLLFFGVLWSLVRRRRFPWRPTLLDLPLAAFGAVLVVSALASPFRVLALGVTLMLLVSGAVYYGAFGWLLGRDPGSRWTLLRAWALGALPAALTGLLVSAATHGRGGIPRGVGPTGLGTTLVLGGVLQLGLAFRSKGWERASWLACGLLSLVGIAVTGSRASLGGWVVGAAYLTWQELRARPRRMAAALAGGAAVVVLAGALVPPFAGRVRDTVSDVSRFRLVVWRTSLGMIAARPLLGTGFGTFQTAYDRVKPAQAMPEPFAYDLALNIAVETGFLGLLAALWVASTAVRGWTKQGERARAGPGDGAGAPGAGWFRAIVPALWIGLFVDQLADNTLFSISTSAALWFLLALTASPSSHETQGLAPTA